jgi:hypothetical protein
LNLSARDHATSRPFCDKQSVPVLVTSVFLLVAILLMVVIARSA